MTRPMYQFPLTSLQAREDACTGGESRDNPANESREGGGQGELARQNPRGGALVEEQRHRVCMEGVVQEAPGGCDQALYIRRAKGALGGETSPRGQKETCELRGVTDGRLQAVRTPVVARLVAEQPVASGTAS